MQPSQNRESEMTLLRRLMTHWSGSGMRLFRNQCGRYQMPDGHWISSGLCVGSSDLIGWTPVIVTQEMVGKPIAVFTAIETKVGKRETTPQQAVFLSRVQQAGGLAVIAREVDDVAVALAKLIAT